MKFVRTFTGCQSANESATRVCFLVRNCLAGAAPEYLSEVCQSTSSTSGRQHLRSALRNDLLVPRVRTANYGARGFAVSGPRLRNSLPMSVRELMTNRNNLKRHSKHFLCSSSERFCGFISEVALYQIFITITIQLSLQIGSFHFRSSSQSCDSCIFCSCIFCSCIFHRFICCHTTTVKLTRRIPEKASMEQSFCTLIIVTPSNSIC